MSPRASGIGVTPWAHRAMSEDSRKVAVRLRLTVIGPAPYVVRHPGLAKELRGRDVDALVLAAAKELTDAG